MKTISIDRTGSLPLWVQIKEQLKLAYSLGDLSEGDVLPSIRALADRLGVGDAIVRRAYQELTQSGFLSAEPRKHLMVSDTLTKPGHVEALAKECTDECDRLIDWAGSRGVSSISLARLFLRQAIQSEQKRPAYVYVDLSKTSAQRFAELISKTWELPVAALTVDELVRLSDAELASFAGVLVNYFRHDRLLASLDGRRATIFPVRTKLHPRIIRKIRRQAAGSSVLLVLPRDDAVRIGDATLTYLEAEVGDNVRLKTATVDDIPDLVAEAESGRYRLVIVSRHLWDDIPEKARRLANVIPNENELIMESLEKARIASGVLV